MLVRHIDSPGQLQVDLPPEGQSASVIVG